MASDSQRQRCSMEVRCIECDKLNRIPEGRAGKIVCGNCKAALPMPGEVLVVTDANFASIVRTPSVVDFWAPWCGPCRIIAPIVEALARDRRQLRFAKLNVDENPATAARYNVSGIPTLIFFDRGEERGRLVGAVGRPQLEQAIDRYLPGSAP